MSSFQPPSPPDSPNPYGHPPAFQPVGAAQSQGLAIGAFVTSLLGLCLPPLGLIGLILGIVALLNANKDPGRYGGKGLAIAGVCVGGSSLIVGCLMAGLLIPAIGRGRQAARQIASQSHMQQIAVALEMYAADNENALPEAGADLQQRLASYLPSPTVWQHPGAEPGMTSYFYVPIGTLEAVKNPASQVMLYENPAIRGRSHNLLLADLSIEDHEDPDYGVIIDGITLPDGTPWTPHLKSPGP